MNDPSRAAPTSGASRPDDASEPGASLFVWVVWALMLLAAGAYVVAFGPEFPIWDDFGFAPVLAGEQPMDLAWLWGWSNEHRYPLAKFLLVTAFKATDFDLRAGMFLSVVALGALALEMIWVAGRLRGATRYTDAFFPVACLNWGHFAAFSWSSVFELVCAPVIGGAFLLLILRPGRPTFSRAAIAAAAMALLPLCGAGGLALVPALSFWFWGSAVSHWRSARSGGRRRALGIAALTAPTLVLSALYFRGFQRPPHHSPSGGFLASLRTTLEFLSLGFGPAAKDLWPFSCWVVPCLLGFSAAILLVAGVRHPEERLRAWGLLAFLAATASLALGLGWGRSGMGALAGLEARYTSMPIPTLCGVYLGCELFAGPAGRRLVPMCLLLSATCALWGNTRLGIKHGEETAAKSAAFRRDLRAGLPAYILVNRHTPFLHPSQDDLLSCMMMLHRAGIRPFRDLRVNPPFREVEVPLTPSRVSLLEWEAGAAHVTGNDPWLSFVLPHAGYVAGIRVRYWHSNATQTSSHFKLGWMRPGQAEFPEGQSYANWALRTGPDRETTVWLGETIGAFRIQPDNQACEFRISGLTLLVP
jgi:hypothetical protein